MPLLVQDSVTKLGAETYGAVVIAGSHAGIYAAYLAAKAGLAAVILSDAGIGKDRAGVGGLAYLDRLGMPAAAIDAMSARIGDGADMAARGIISHVNATAAALGVNAGQTVMAAAERLAAAPLTPCPTPPPETEARKRLTEAERGGVRVHAVDSVSLVLPEDIGQIVITGSHGGILGGKPESAIRQEVYAALYVDAGGAADGSGFSRLPALDPRGIAAATVTAASARIGDGLSVYETGMISAINDTARAKGCTPTMSARAFVSTLVEAWIKEKQA